MNLYFCTYTVYQHFLLDTIDLACRVPDLLEMCGTFALSTVCLIASEWAWDF